MTPVEELREAAKLLRERAKAAASECPTPWHQAPIDPRPNRGLFTATGGPIGDIAESCELPKLSDYIASMHPGVGLLLAAWWDCVAIDEEQGEPETAPRIRERTAALQLARVYLGKSTKGGAR